MAAAAEITLTNSGSSAAEVTPRVDGAVARIDRQRRILAAVVHTAQ
jgi:hypothetical protein